MLALNAGVEGAESVNEGFQLGGHTVVVQRSDKHHHVCAQDFPPNLLHVILLDAGAFVAAMDTAGAGMDVGMSSVDKFHGVPRFFRPLLEAVCQQVGRTVFIGASLQHDNIHPISLPAPNDV